MRNCSIVVGLCGQFGAGCTQQVAKFLVEELGFKHFSLSKYVRQEVAGAPGYKELRRLLQDIGNQMREKHGSHFLAEKVIKEIGENGATEEDLVIDSIRNPGEIEFLRKIFWNFLLISVHASFETRWERLRKDYAGDQKQFEEDDQRDKGDAEPDYGQKVQNCMDLADITILNDEQFTSQKAYEEFCLKVYDYIELMRNPGRSQPTYEELFMNIAYSMSLKSQCSRRQVGAVIVSRETEKDVHGKYIISSGYNDVPIGELPCSEMGGKSEPNFCYRENKRTESLQKISFCPQCGQKLDDVVRKSCSACHFKFDKDLFPGKMLDLCRAVHAEEAAILQAARLGSVSLRDCILYTTTFPCLLCSKKIINSGIIKVVFHESYPMKESLEMLRKCRIETKNFMGVNARAFQKLYKS